MRIKNEIRVALDELVRRFDEAVTPEIWYYLDMYQVDGRMRFITRKKATYRRLVYGLIDVDDPREVMDLPILKACHLDHLVGKELEEICKIGERSLFC